ncbi:MAG: VOC family protein [Novosphingobium sp.]|jgi:4-hydroxyphenylpyruvate dioxygenase-like putative hemolysin|nr:VOC family protein [Novosphingobium sp.]
MTAANPLHPSRYLHTIHAAPACERLRQIYTHVFGGITFHESYYPPEDRDAALIYVADHMIEVMSPRHGDDMAFMYARYLAKAGPGYHSISFRVDNVPAARARCDELGVKINTEGPGLIFLHPKSTGGLIMELTDHRMPNDPWDLPNWRRDWAFGRPQKPHALAHIVCAPRFPETALRFLVEALDGTAQAPVTVDWPERATATRVDVADMTLVVLQPDDTDGALARFAGGTNGGVYALAWQVGDPPAMAEWFGNNNIFTVAAEPLADAGPYTHEVVLDGARHWFVKG